MRLIPTRIAAAIACLRGHGVMYRIALVETEIGHLEVRPYEAPKMFVEMAGRFLLPGAVTAITFQEGTIYTKEAHQ